MALTGPSVQVFLVAFVILSVVSKFFTIQWFLALYEEFFPVNCIVKLALGGIIMYVFMIIRSILPDIAFGFEFGSFLFDFTTLVMTLKGYYSIESQTIESTTLILVTTLKFFTSMVTTRHVEIIRNSQRPLTPKYFTTVFSFCLLTVFFSAYLFRDIYLLRKTKAFYIMEPIQLCILVLVISDNLHHIYLLYVFVLDSEYGFNIYTQTRLHTYGDIFFNLAPLIISRFLLGKLPIEYVFLGNMKAVYSAISEYIKFLEIYPYIVNVLGHATEEDLRYDDQCLICKCSIELSESRKLHCRHYFHVDCLLKWIVKSSKCPVCKTKIK